MAPQDKWRAGHAAGFVAAKAQEQPSKLRIVLNKADMVDHQELMRVYGALMWSLGKVQGWMNGPPITS